MGDSLKVALGSFIDLAGSQTIVGLGLGTTVKALIMWGNMRVADGTEPHASMFIGAASAPASQGCVNLFGRDAVDPSDEMRQKFNTKIAAANFGDGFNYTNSITDMSVVDQFTIHGDTGSGSVINYLALGGEISAKAKWNTVPTAVGLQSTTGIGFSPEAELFLLNGLSQAIDASPDAEIGVGMMNRNSNQAWNYFASLDNTSIDPLPLASGIRSLHSTSFNQCLARINVTANPFARFYEASASTMDADGDTKDWTTVTGSTTDEYLTLALKGVSLHVGNAVKSGTVGEQTFTGSAFPPKAALFFVRRTPQPVFSATIGAAISPRSRSTIWTGEEEGATSMKCDQALDRSACIRMMTAGTPTLNCLADFVRHNGDGVTVNWTTNAFTDSGFFFMFLGDRVSVRILGKTHILGNTAIL